MWQKQSASHYRFHADAWCLDVQAGSRGITAQMVVAKGSPESLAIELDGGFLPPLKDSFLRGSDLHLNLPQDDLPAQAGSFAAASTQPGAIQAGMTQAGLEAVLSVLRSDADVLVLEAAIGLQTQWLDVHPAVRVQLPFGGTAVMSERGSSLVVRNQDSGVSRTASLVVLIDERDRWSVTPSTTDGVRFFGDFMEKGVIRKVQPWFVWSRRVIDEAFLETLLASLGSRPLPLAG
jgi:hypothetical protein